MVDIGNLIKIKGNINDGIKTALKDVSKAFTITQLDIDDLEASEDNFYKLNDINGIKESIENFGLQQNLVVMKRESKKYEIIAGHRRFKACKLLVAEGKREFSDIPCRILPTMDSTLKNILIIHTNSEARVKTAWEISEEVARLTILYRDFKKQHPEFKGRVREAVAKDLGLSTSTLGKHENVNNNLIAPLKEQYKENKIGISNADSIASLPAEQQEQALKMFKEKGTIAAKDISEIKNDQKNQEEILEPDSGNDPESWEAEEEATEETASPGSATNEYGIYKERYIEQIKIDIPKRLGEIIVKIAQDPEDRLFRKGIRYISSHSGSSYAPSKKQKGYATKDEAVRAALTHPAVTGDEKIKNALVKLGYIIDSKPTTNNQDDYWDEYGRTKPSKYDLIQRYKDYNKVIQIKDDRLPEGGFVLYLVQDKEDGLWRSSAARGFVEVGSERWPHRDMDNPKNSKTYPAFDTMEEALQYAASKMFWFCNASEEAILEKMGYKKQEERKPQKSWQDMTPCEQCRSANPQCADDHCCKTCAAPCNCKQICRLDNSSEKPKVEENQETEAEFMIPEEIAKPKELPKENQSVEQWLVKIEAAKHAMKLLEKEINRCASLRKIEEDKGNTAKADQHIANIEYLGGLMKNVQADLFDMTGNDMFKI